MIKATDFIIRRFYYRTSNVKLRPKKSKDSRPKGQLRKTGKIWIILLVRLKACGFGTVCLVALLRNASRSNLRRLADKRACRLGFARLSAPSLVMRARRKRDKSLPLRQKKQKDSRPKGQLSFWRRRRDLDSRAGKTRPTPLAGAPLRPLEYFSVTGCRLVTCRIIISIIFAFVNTFFRKCAELKNFSSIFYASNAKEANGTADVPPFFDYSTLRPVTSRASPAPSLNAYTNISRLLISVNSA